MAKRSPRSYFRCPSSPRLARVVTVVVDDLITVRPMSGGLRASVGLIISSQIASQQHLTACANAVILLAIELLIIAAFLRIVDIQKEPRWLSPSPLPAAGRPALFILLPYGPTRTILMLSFQGPDGELTFSMNGVPVHWFARLIEAQA
jgi:hypothetical protein